MPGAKAMKILCSVLMIILFKKEKRATSFLRQRISIAVQRGNIASVLGTIPYVMGLSELYLL